MELLIILVIVLVVFGPKRLPQLGRQLGGGMREFKNSITAKDDGSDDEDEANPTLAAAPPAAQPAEPVPAPEVVDAQHSASDDS